VPIDVRRRTARALATLTTEHLWPGEQRKIEARFGEASPVYRPDQGDIAYWEIEIEIEGVETVLPVPEGQAKEYDKGFIVVATGAHDVPVPHFSLSQALPRGRPRPSAERTRKTATRRTRLGSRPPARSGRRPPRGAPGTS
jgi:hypothetical protein